MADSFAPRPLRPTEPVSKQAHQVQLMHKSADRADIEQQIAYLIRTSVEPETLLSAIADALGQAFQVDCCIVAVTDGQGESLPTSVCTPYQTVYGYPSLTQAILSSEPMRQLGVPVMESGRDEEEILAICDVFADEGAKSRNSLWEALKVRTLLGVKTQFQGQVNGGIAVMRSQLYCWTDADRELLKAVSNQVAIAISQVVQTRVIGSLQKQVGAFAQHRHLIKQLTMAIHNALDLNQILQMAIEGLVQTLSVSQGLILLVKYVDPLFATRSTPGAAKRIPKAKMIVCASSSAKISPSSPPIGTPSNQSFWMSDCILSSSAFKKVPLPLAIADRRDTPNPNSEIGLSSFSRAEDMPAILLVPLLGATSSSSNPGTVLGFLVLQDSEPRNWVPDELDMVEVVGAQVSTAIIQTQKIQHVQALVEERTSQLQRSLEVQAKLYEKTRQQVDQLRRLNQLKDDFVSTMSHELRTPLTSMTLAIRMLRQPGLSTERREKYLEILEQQCNQETNLIEDLLKLQQLESNALPVQMQKIDLKNLLRDLEQSFQPKWASKGLMLAVDMPLRSLKIETDIDSLNRIFQELFTNAGKYSEPGTSIILRVDRQMDRDTDRIIFSLTNTGAGISEEELPHIFEKFRRGAGVTQAAIAGTGLGLALVKCLVQQLNGTIEVSSHPLGHKPAWETCFTLTLPQQFDINKV